MVGRIASHAFVALALATSVAAQDGQGANARPDATPPTRPSSLPPNATIFLAPRAPVGVGGGRVDNLLLITPGVRPFPPDQATGPVYESGGDVKTPGRIRAGDPLYTATGRGSG